MHAEEDNREEGTEKGRGEVPGMSDRGCCLRLWHTVALGGDRRWRCSGCFSFSPQLLPASSSSGCSLSRRGCGCCDEVVQPVVAAVELEEDGVGFLWQRKKEEEEKSAEIVEY